MDDRLANLLLGPDLAAVSRLAIVAAHPDDETIGLGAQMRQLGGAWLIHITNGSPRDLRDAHAAGMPDNQSYAQMRRHEMQAALHLAHWNLDHWITLDAVDQEASYCMAALAKQLAGILQTLRIACVVTHPYEGGHPDHDATAFVVNTSCRLMSNPPRVVEMTSYHRHQGRFCAGSFFPNEQCPVTSIALSCGERAFKAALFACFRSQRAVLKQFSAAQDERFRPAPNYDFLSPPGPEPPYYEMFSWGMTGTRWRDLCRAALETSLQRCSVVAVPS